MDLLGEGDAAVKTVRKGLIKRGIKAGESIMTQFNTDEDIPIYDEFDNKIFWISVKTVYLDIRDPVTELPNGYLGWMCGEVESKQWVYPPAVIIWWCNNTKVAWGAITPPLPKRPSTEWIIYPDRHGTKLDKRKSRLTGNKHYLYPSYCVPPNRILSKEGIITHIQELCE